MKRSKIIDVPTATVRIGLLNFWISNISALRRKHGPLSKEMLQHMRRMKEERRRLCNAFGVHHSFISELSPIDVLKMLGLKR